MPLHREHPPGQICRLRALDHAVANGSSGDAERRRHPGQCLMVKGIRPQVIRAEGVRQTRAGIDADIVDAGIARSIRVVRDGIGELTRDVLHERSAEGDVRHLNAAADRERGQAASVRFENEGDLALVARLMRLDRRMGLLAISCGRHVLAASDHKAGDTAENYRRAFRGQRRDDEGQQSGRGESLGIREVDADAWRTANDLGRGGDGDERCAGVDRQVAAGV